MAKKEQIKVETPTPESAPAKLAVVSKVSGFVGKVTSNKMDKTVVVAITVAKKHKRYAKYTKSTKKFMAHDENNECGIGDKVEIVESRPLSKLKRWRVANLVEKAV